MNLLDVVDLSLLVLDDHWVMRALDNGSQVLDEGLEMLVDLQEYFSLPALFHQSLGFSLLHLRLGLLEACDLVPQLTNCPLILFGLLCHHLAHLVLHFLQLAFSSLLLLVMLLDLFAQLLVLLHQILYT